MTTQRTASRTTLSTIDEYLAPLPPDQRAALQKLRKSIRAIVPSAEGCISYGVPAFRSDAGVLIGFAASKKHCSIYPMSGRIIAALKKDLAGYETTKGSIHFQPEKPPPVALVRKLIKARMAELTRADRR